MAALESRTMSEGHQHQRTEPLLLRPTTLPHGPGPVDPGAAGERVDLKSKPLTVMQKPLPPITPIPSTVELVQSASQTLPIPEPRSQSSWSAIFLIVVFIYTLLFYISSSLRLSFYIFMLTMTIGLTLAACKFTEIWDPCKFIFMNTTECTVSSYFKGMIYHTDCTETHTCVLPGFDSVIHQQGWSLYKPNITTTTGTVIFQ